MKEPQTLFEKVWNRHVVLEEADSPAVLYVDLHLIHEVTSPQAFDGLRRRGLAVRRPDRTFATVDHSIPTVDPSIPVYDEQAARQIAQLESNAAGASIRLFGSKSSRRGIVHVIGPENGLTQPGMTVVCGDSHTATHGAFGALAFGIGTSEVEHVLATQCLLQRKPKTMQVEIVGSLQHGVTAKDTILALLAKIGIGGGTGHVIEYTGEAIRSLSMEERMTVCNMSIEGGARAGMIAPDETTFKYLAHKEYAPRGAAWNAAVSAWRSLHTDEGAAFDKKVTLNISDLVPMITYGTNPGLGIRITDPIPNPSAIGDRAERTSAERALAYMDLQPGALLLGKPVDVVFIGSCTNSRLSDLRAAAQVLKGRKIHPRVRTLIVPGSQEIKRQAEAEGIHTIFKNAGAEWRESGCSMCIAMNGDQVGPGQVAVSTSNRNFEGRQGKGARTFLASPLTAAASAVMGSIADVRILLNSQSD